MNEGIVADIKELIALKRFAPSVSYPPQTPAMRQGEHLSKMRGRGMDFSEVRNYQAGDEIRHMEWRVTARTGRPHVKIFQEERERPVLVMADFSPSMFFGTRIAFKSVVAARLAALISWTAMKQGDRVGAILFSEQSHTEIHPRARQSGVLSVLAALSQMTQQQLEQFRMDPALFSKGIEKLRRVSRPGSIIVLISDFYGMTPECDHHLRQLSQHNQIIAYQVCDPLELKAPPPRQYAVTNGIQEALLDTRDQSIARGYDQFCHQRNEQLKARFKKLNIEYAQVSAADDLSLLLRKTYPRRRKNG